MENKPTGMPVVPVFIPAFGGVIPPTGIACLFSDIPPKAG